MKVRVKTDRSVASKGTIYTAGQTLDLPNDRAVRLIACGYVEKITEKAKTAKNK